MSDRQTLTVLHDPVADTLDDLAALGEHWTRNRARGRMPNGIRAAMVLVARELVMYEDIQLGNVPGPIPSQGTEPATERKS